MNTSIKQLENAAAPPLPDLRVTYQESYSALTVDSWAAVFSTFMGHSPDQLADPQQRRLVKGWAAQLLETSYTKSQETGRNAPQFGQELDCALANIALPSFLLEVEAEPVSGKRQPPFLESIEATLARLEVIEKLPDAFGAEALILAGSMRYGPFFSVRKYNDGPGTFCSDIDILMVADEHFGGTDDKQMIENGLFTTHSIAGFLKRKRIFADLHARGQADVFAHRFDVAGHDFNVSVHALPPEDFSSLFSERLAKDLARKTDILSLVKSYKHVAFSHTTCDRRGFDGSVYEYKVLEQSAVEGGYIAELPAYAIDHGRFYPGFWHDMLLPDCAVYSDNTGQTTATATSFQGLLLGRLAQEQEQYPGASLVKSLVRSDVFAPERYDTYGGKNVPLPQN